MEWDGKVSLVLAAFAVLIGAVGAPTVKAQGQKPNMCSTWNNNFQCRCAP